MKFSKLLLLFCACLVVLSCKDDDGNDGASNTNNYFPTAIGTDWTYMIEIDGFDAQEDILFIDRTTQTDGHSYTDIESDVPLFGFVTGILEANLLRTENGQLLAKGQIGAPIDGFPEIMIELNDFVMYDANVSSGELDAIAGVLEQEIQEIPLEFEYEFKTHALPATSNLMVNGVNYDDIVNTGFTLTLEVTAQIEVGGFVIPFPILSEQEVVTGTASFAKDTGFIWGESTVDYQLEDLSGLGIKLPFPTEATTLTSETITDFELGN